MLRKIIVIFTAVIIAGSVYAKQKTAQSGIWLAWSSMTEMKLPSTGDVPYLLLDFEYPENNLPKVYAADFNGDGVVDYLVESYKSLCGTGGCLYALVDGKTNKRIGDFGGSPILVLDQKINNYPIIQSYGHSSAVSGSFVTYVFDGKKYQAVSSVVLKDQSVKDLFDSLDGFRRIKVN